MPDGLSDPSHTARQEWMALLAQASREEMEEAWRLMLPNPPYAILRKAETGLAMVRGRAGGTGNPFNLGEMTMTRCAVRLEAEPRVVGLSYIAGRDPRRAELAALFDALLQTPQLSADVKRTLLTPIRRRLDETRRVRAAESAATRVDFFTLVREQGVE